MSSGQHSPRSSSPSRLSPTPDSRSAQRGQSSSSPKVTKKKSKSASPSKDPKPSSSKDAIESKGWRIGETRPGAPEATATVGATKSGQHVSTKTRQPGEARLGPPDVKATIDVQAPSSPEGALKNRPEPRVALQGREEPPKLPAPMGKSASHEDIVPPSCDVIPPTSTVLFVHGGPGPLLVRKTNVAVIAVMAFFTLLVLAGLIYLAATRTRDGDVPASCYDSDGDLLVETSLGVIRGLSVESVDGRRARVFLGIPFGGNVSGERRFELASAVDKLSSPFSAVKQGPACLQPVMYTVGQHQPTSVSDDCLHINVYTPSGCSLRKEALPVLFFTTGWTSCLLSWNNMYDWQHLASRGRLVVVAPNYRLGVVGFLNRGTSSNTSNLGVQDVLLAWKWTRKHISAFGGDADNVIPFAHASASIMMTALLSKPRLLNARRAVILSQSLFTPTRNNSGPAGLASTREAALQAGCCAGSECLDISEPWKCHSHSQSQEKSNKKEKQARIDAHEDASRHTPPKWKCANHPHSQDESNKEETHIGKPEDAGTGTPPKWKCANQPHSQNGSNEEKTHISTPEDAGTGTPPKWKCENHPQSHDKSTMKETQAPMSTQTDAGTHAPPKSTTTTTTKKKTQTPIATRTEASTHAPTMSTTTTTTKKKTQTPIATSTEAGTHAPTKWSSDDQPHSQKSTTQETQAHIGTNTDAGTHTPPESIVRCLSRMDPLQLVSKMGEKFCLSQMNLLAEPFHVEPQRPAQKDYFRGMQFLMGSTRQDYDRLFRAWIAVMNLTDAPFQEVVERLLHFFGAPSVLFDWIKAYVGSAQSREQQISNISNVGTLTRSHCPMTYYATEATKYGAEVRFFVLDEDRLGPRDGSRLSSSYGDDLWFLSGGLLADANATKEQRLLSEELMDNLAAFARNGIPGPVRGLGEWPLRSEVNGEVLFLRSDGSYVKNHWLKDICTTVMNLIVQTLPGMQAGGH